MAELERLSAEEVRVIGVLMEKEMTTPDYYPLSLNSLTTACNQKSNRDPVVNYDESLVEETIAGLRHRQLVVQSGAGRVPRYAHNLAARFDLITPEAAILCLLMVRGPQTAGELRSRSARMHGFASLEEVRETIESLVDMGLVKKLPRQPGRKESRFMHLLSGDAVPAESAVEQTPATSGTAAEIAELKARLEALEEEFREFKRQFE